MSNRRPSASVAADPERMRAAGYHCPASRTTWSMMWLGTTIHGLVASPSRRSSIAPMRMVPVFPAPTTWSSSTVGSETMRAAALRWYGYGAYFSPRPGKLMCAPECVGATRELNRSL